MLFLKKRGGTGVEARRWKRRLVCTARALLFALLSVGAMRLAANLLCAVEENPLNRAGEGLYRQRPGSIDVVYVGPSHVYSSIIPQYIFDQYGITGYDFATAAQSFESTYWALCEAIRLQHPRIAVVELVCAAADPAVRQAPIYYTGLCRLLSPFSPLKYPAFLELLRCERQSFSSAAAWSDGAADRLSWTDFWRLTTFHAQYGTLCRRSFTEVWGPPLYEKSKGYSPVFARNPQSAGQLPAYSPAELEAAALSPQAVKTLERMKAAAERSGTRLVFMVAPYMTDLREEKLYAQARGWAAQQGIEVLDFNLKKEELGIDPALDYADKSHLNYYGACKVSGAMGAYLAGTGLFQDKRQARGYEGWQRDAHCYETWEKVARLGGTECSAAYAAVLAGLGGDYLAVLAGVPDETISAALVEAGLSVQPGVGFCALFDGKRWEVQCGVPSLEGGTGGHRLAARCDAGGAVAEVDGSGITAKTGVSALVYDALADKVADQAVLQGEKTVHPPGPENDPA